MIVSSSTHKRVQRERNKAVLEAQEALLKAIELQVQCARLRNERDAMAKRLDDAASRVIKMEVQCAELKRERNDLADRINKAQAFPQKQTTEETFTSEEINALVNLCHPDKHNGSERANSMTARLLKLRRKA